MLLHVSGDTWSVTRVTFVQASEVAHLFMELQVLIVHINKSLAEKKITCKGDSKALKYQSPDKSSQQHHAMARK